jgi:hypothetical protein
MGLPQQDLKLLTSQNIHTARDLLTQSPVDIMERLNIPLSQAQRLLQHIAVQVAPPYVTVSTLVASSSMHAHNTLLPVCAPACVGRLCVAVPQRAPSTAAVCSAHWAMYSALRIPPPPPPTPPTLPPALHRPYSYTAPSICTPSKFSLVFQ